MDLWTLDLVDEDRSIWASSASGRGVRGEILGFLAHGWGATRVLGDSIMLSFHITRGAEVHLKCEPR
jgi:hypothetical protein